MDLHQTISEINDSLAPLRQFLCVCFQVSQLMICLETIKEAFDEGVVEESFRHGFLLCEQVDVLLTG